MDLFMVPFLLSIPTGYIHLFNYEILVVEEHQL